MNAKKVNENMSLKIKNYINHKVKVIEERVYWACIDKIFDAENYDEYDIDDDNNMYVSYSLNKDESINMHPYELINTQIVSEYRKKLKSRLMKDDFYVIFEDDDIKIYFTKPVLHTISNFESDDDSEENIITYKNKISKSDKNDNVEFGIINIDST
jgi:hypothetical protein